MNPTGELAVTLRWDGARVVGATSVFQRAPASRLLLGRSPAEVLEWVPRLFSLCGRAQATAARAALIAAGEPMDSGEPIAEPSHRGVLAEVVQEHLWRLLRDWPRALDVAPLDAELAMWFQRLSGDGERALPHLAALRSLVEDRIAGPGFEALTDLGGLRRWAHDGTGLGASLVRQALDEPEVANAPIAGITATDRIESLVPAGDAPWTGRWEEQPERAGAPVETGALARQVDHPLVAAIVAARGPGLLARLVARVRDLLDATARFVDGGVVRGSPVTRHAVAPGVGIARVETARGVLLHRVVVKDGRMADYSIVAPTAWSFHPRGAFAGAVGQCVAEDESALRAQAARWVLAFDPCVPWRLEIMREAAHA